MDPGNFVQANGWLRVSTRQGESTVDRDGMPELGSDDGDSTFYVTGRYMISWCYP